MTLQARFLSVLTTLTFAASLQAGTVWYANLNGAAENPAVSTTATGYILVTLSGNLLSISESFSGLTGGAAAAAHIHCCAAAPLNVGVALPFTGFPNATSGFYTATFDLTLVATYTASFVTASGGTAAGAQAALLAGLNGGQAYANIHDAANPGGEIRGQLLNAPEPTSSVLLLVGLLPAIAVIGRRRRK